MGPFKNPAQRKAELERRKALSAQERMRESLCDNPLIINNFAEQIPGHVKQFMRINVDSFDLGPDEWEKIYLFHQSVWTLKRRYSIADRNLVYHLGLANLAKNMVRIQEEIKNEDENRPALLQRLFVLQFGEPTPDPFREFNMLATYPDCVEGFVRWQPKQSPAEAVKEAVSQLLANLSAANSEERSRFYNAQCIFMDGCIRVMGDLIAHLCLSDLEFEWDIPENWSDGKKRTIGNIFDDYLSLQ